MRITIEQYNELIKKKNKYNAKPCTTHGYRFSSTAESDFYKILLRKMQFKEIEYFLRQVPFHLPGNIRMYVDFMVYEKDGKVRYIDVKGQSPTPAWIIKQKSVHALYPVIIETIKKKEITALKRQYGI